MEFRIQLNSVEDAVRLVNTLEHHNYHADATIESYTINARSLLGILGYGIGRVMTVVFYEMPNEDLGCFMNQYVAA